MKQRACLLCGLVEGTRKGDRKWCQCSGKKMVLETEPLVLNNETPIGFSYVGGTLYDFEGAPYSFALDLPTNYLAF